MKPKYTLVGCTATLSDPDSVRFSVLGVFWLVGRS